MRCWDDDRRDELAAEFPGWDVWYVRNVVERRNTWCARPKGAPAAIFHASHSETLAGKIRTAEAQVGKP